jgi:hypothetical protein
MSKYQKVRLQVSHGPDLHFEGKVLHQFSTQNKAATKPRWTELRLWETPAGNWIAESVGMSTHEREGEIREADVIEESRDSKLRVMEIFQWTSAAKAFARELGWDVIRRVD